VLEHPELMDLVMPLLRADFALLETHRHRPGPPLPCPITACGGLSDPDVSDEEVEGWREHAGGPFRKVMLPGNHFFLLHEAGDELRRVVGRALVESL
jgi:surfactin synthase thioesterase subunit